MIGVYLNIVNHFLYYFCYQIVAIPLINVQQARHNDHY